MEIYYIGGSPCSGKSTVAEALAQQYGLAYFKADAPRRPSSGWEQNSITSSSGVPSRMSTTS